MAFAIQDTFNRYWNGLPDRNLTRIIAQSALISFAAGTLFSGGNPVCGLAGAAIAATATIIDALVRPIINHIFPDPQSISRFFVNAVVVFSLTSLAATSLATLTGIAVTVNIVAAVAATTIVNFILGNNVDPREASIYVITAT